MGDWSISSWDDAVKLNKPDSSGFGPYVLLA